MRKFRLGLLGRILIAIGLGIALGTCLPDALLRIFFTFNGLFSEFLGFFIPLLIVGLVAPAIADLGKGAGKMLVVTVAIAYLSTFCSGMLAYLTGATLFPSMISPGTPLDEIGGAEQLLPYFTVNIPPIMDVTTALVMAFMLGLGIAHLDTNALRQVCYDFRSVVEKTINVVIIPLLPLYIFGIFLGISHSDEVAQVLSVFVKIIGVIFVLHVAVLLIQYGIAGLMVHRNPFKLLVTMLPAYFTALGTQSSAATIPVTLRQSIKNEVSPNIAGFTVPLCATIHMAGSMLKITACALALMIMQGMPYDLPMFVSFILMLGVMMVAAPGVPGGAIMAALGVLTSILGFGESDKALMIALYIAMDSFGTACNVTGDGAIALIVNHIFRKQTAPVPNTAESAATPQR